MLGNLLIRKNLRSMDCYNQAGGLKLHWDRYSFSGPICWRIFLLPSGNLTVCELENGNLWLVYRLIMVIFHSFLCVYQWVGGRFLWMQNLQELKRRWKSRGHRSDPGHENLQNQQAGWERISFQAWAEWYPGQIKHGVLENPPINPTYCIYIYIKLHIIPYFDITFILCSHLVTIHVIPYCFRIYPHNLI